MPYLIQAFNAVISNGFNSLEELFKTISPPNLRGALQ
jgi:hypothetical protein